MRKRYSPIPKPFASPFDASADDPPPATDASFRPPRKKIAGGIRAWLLVDAAGEAQVVEAGKHSIMRRTGLPARDLRILDPLLSYPSTVLGRERAIVINLENIKAIITAQEVLLLNSRDPAVIPFVEELQRRILRLQRGTKEAQKEGSGNEAECASPSSGGEDNTKGEGRGGYENTVGSRELPFEFIALEACLEAACSCLETEARTLEQEAHPALDKLTSKISTLNLERVRQIKSRLVAITGRVQKVRDELEHLLDDDEDMAEMYLTEKMMHQRLDGSSSVSSVNEGRAFVDDGVLPPELERIRGEISAEGNDMDTFEGDLPDTENMDGTTSVPSMLRVYSHRTRSSSTRSGSKHLDIEELEMLLEAYFVQIDGTLNKLSTLREYVDDTEDYINIMLDDKQNHLLQMGVMLTTATLVVSAFVVVAGIFGMNINIDLFDKKKAGTRDFVWTVGGGTIGSFVLYVVAIAWCKHKRLLE